jgi:hypothetical protein
MNYVRYQLSVNGQVIFGPPAAASADPRRKATRMGLLSKIW